MGDIRDPQDTEDQAEAGGDDEEDYGSAQPQEDLADQPR
jgi:hypothetical protein